MSDFPQQIKTEKLARRLRKFYKDRNQEVTRKLEKYQRSSVAGAKSENKSEVDYNRRQLQKLYNQLENGEEKVSVEWYEPVVERSAPPKVSMQKRSFELEHRYGNWIKHDHDLR